MILDDRRHEATFVRLPSPEAYCSRAAGFLECDIETIFFAISERRILPIIFGD
jgi:hypothetical protein